MATNAERFYEQMDSLQALNGLIGQPEDADFDCKQWLRADAVRGSIAKAACGFTNATGGVIVVGVKASGRGADVADVVQSLDPVVDRENVASQALDIILKFVEPGIEGIRVKTIPSAASGVAGFVLIFIPASDGAVRRSKVDWRFYVRIASGTVPMEYFQVEERFGRRPHPRLSIQIEPEQMVKSYGYNQNPLRHILFGLKNDGRGIAKFPGIRFAQSTNLGRDNFGLDGNGGTGLPWRPSESGWIVFRGGVDDVIYPGETRLIGKLVQSAVNKGDKGIFSPGQPFLGFHRAERLWVCEAMAIEYEISCEGLATQKGVCQLNEDSLSIEFQVR